MRTILVGSRKSKLALAQTYEVIDALLRIEDHFDFSIVHLLTKGDRMKNVPLSNLGGKGVFVKEIERALLDGKIDLAVHSMKDMPTVLPDGLEIISVPKRADARDVLISRTGASLNQLSPGTVIGTGSLRRAAQILHVRPDIKIRHLRGNVDTRLKRLANGDFDAIILAAAGLQRLGLSYQDKLLPLSVMLPAAGQGALAVECRSADTELKTLLRKINDDDTERTVRAERAFQQKLNGSCRVPIAAFCKRLNDTTLQMNGLVSSIDGRQVLKTDRTGENPEELGLLAAKDLLRQGAAEILEGL
ncbi:hydroxymethylbilane synthase [Sporolactobacillus shoreicorticis]|uniref:Porphobilinogen deaminase n=1 Tax=Sporolactobacillus shoreicorticis TaxID=1923877 RepID=A0ABW5RZP4_9BACL|nr:hydroxymethylbilane synthase [Sporolactobacillus shoreicorticis]MCO7125186.1 hydroxymethylbilane synthase [Sporolactobacillus shoreicorticis]